MRFKDIKLECLDTDMGDGNCEGNYIVPATDELIDAVNKIRERQGNTDLVGEGFENDVYYTYYLHFNADKQEIDLQASVAYGEKDDYVWYVIDLFPEEKQMLLWKVIGQLLIDMEV